jgi:hypothetical protein
VIPSVTFRARYPGCHAGFLAENRRLWNVEIGREFWTPLRLRAG